jgi:hypothetical protein
MFCFSRDGEVHGYFVAEAERLGFKPRFRERCFLPEFFAVMA